MGEQKNSQHNFYVVTSGEVSKAEIQEMIKSYFSIFGMSLKDIEADSSVEDEDSVYLLTISASRVGRISLAAKVILDEKKK